MSTGPDSAEIGRMFDSIAPRYDFLNHFLSFGFDRIWRRRAVRIVGKNCDPRKIVDVATGTGDLAISLTRLKPDSITGIDISPGMLEKGREKIAKRKLTGIIEFKEGGAEKMPLPDNTFNAATVAFGVRNFNDPLEGLKEMNRVLIPGGIIMVLEFSNPVSFPFKQLFAFYFRNILPLLGRMISGDSRAYTYLPESVKAFPDNDRFLDLMEQAGFERRHQRRLTGGVASIYTGFKSESNIN